MSGAGWLQAVLGESVGLLASPGLGKCLGSEDSQEGRDMKWPQQPALSHPMASSHSLLFLVETVTSNTLSHVTKDMKEAGVKIQTSLAD